MKIFFLNPFRMRSFAYLFGLCFLRVAVGIPRIPNRNDIKDSIMDNSVVEQPLGTKERRTRLPKVVVPLYYDLHYKIYLPTYDVDVGSEYKADGSLAVEIEVTETTNLIEMHASKLNISKVSLQGNESSRTLDSKYVESEKISLSDGQPILKGLYNLTLVYHGFLEQNDQHGIYSDPFTSGGKQYASAVTQMESNSARKMVPCFDEPEYKAVWRVTVVHPKGSTAISNGPIISSQEILHEDEKSASGWMITKYGETPKMSSYLIALAVGKMEFIEGTARNGTFPIRVYGRPEDVKKCQYLLEIAIKSFDYFEQRFQIPYPLSKLDFFVPQRFPHGGMENWGLIVVNKWYSLFNGHNHRDIAEVAAHEIAHTWFGNLVTMKWWNEFWLNEGLDTLMTNDALQFLDKGFKQDADLIVYEEMGLKYSYPLVLEKSVSDVMDDFEPSPAVYQKGAMVGVMLRGVIGEEAFEDALKTYLTKFSYRNTISADFLTHLRKAQLKHKSAPDLDVYEIGMDFTIQRYYPVIDVTENGDGYYKVQQRTYIDIDGQTWNGTWNVPLFVYNSDTNGYNATLLSKGKPLRLTQINESPPPIVNYDSLGVYRVCYSKGLMEKIILYIMNNKSALTARTRARIVIDSHKCDIELMESAGILLNTETDSLVRRAILDGLKEYKPAHPKQYNKYFSHMVRKQLDVIRIQVSNNPLNENVTFPAQYVEEQEIRTELNLLCVLEPDVDDCVKMYELKRNDAKEIQLNKKGVSYNALGIIPSDFHGKFTRDDEAQETIQYFGLNENNLY